jgi:hypothetical protein
VTVPEVVSEVAEAAPRVGVTRVGAVAKTTDPVPVVVTDTRFLDASVATACDAFRLETCADAAVRRPPVVTVPEVVRLVAEATPRIGVTNVGVFDKTLLPVPVDVVTPVPPFTTGNTPEKAEAGWNDGVVEPLLVRTYPDVEDGMDTRVLLTSVAITW